MIVLNEVCKTYYRGRIAVPALRGVSLEIGAGEFLAIMGPSGSGKSTLMNIIGCLDSPDSGTYRLGEIAVEAASEDALAAIRNRRFGFIFQLFNLIPRIDAQRNVALPMVYAKIRPGERQRRAAAVLARVGLGDRLDHSAAELSGGQQQRVAIARALVNEPDILIGDEPTGSLDSVSGQEIMQIFSKLNTNGKTVIIVTHEETIAAYAKRIIRLRDGRIEADECR
ncbi:ABC transporter ATP-binding protein [Nitrospira defluvii]|nr:ABC transporter ATP-binding protein [Nitrospira defluvii]